MAIEIQRSKKNLDRISFQAKMVEKDDRLSHIQFSLCLHKALIRIRSERRWAPGMAFFYFDNPPELSGKYMDSTVKHNMLLLSQSFERSISLPKLAAHVNNNLNRYR